MDTRIQGFLERQIHGYTEYTNTQVHRIHRNTDIRVHRIYTDTQDTRIPKYPDKTRIHETWNMDTRIHGYTGCTGTQDTRIP